MRADLPGPVAEAIERCEGPCLVFDRATLERNLRAAAAAARASGATVLFAAKSFPHPEVLALAARWLDGFDVGSAGELASVPAARVVSIADPTGCAVAHAARVAGAARVIVACETPAQVRAAPAHAELAIRLSASLTGADPAIGAVLDGSGHRRSRFGLDVDRELRRRTIAAMMEEARGRPIGLHVHHGPVTATSGPKFAATAHAALEAAAEASLRPAFLDLGGAWHGVPDLSAALAEVRAAVPPELELILEPGRALVAGAGFACGRVVAARALDDRALRVVELSRICHLRWSQVELVGAAPRPGAGRPVMLVGPTCFEDDVLGEWLIEPDRLAEGARVVLRHVTGYAVAWNASFGGVPPAAIAIV